MKKSKHKKACHFTTRPDHNDTAPATSVPLEIVKLEDNSYHLITSVEINGVKGDIIIDTGASVTVADQKIIPPGTGKNTDIEMQSGSVSGQINNVKVVKIDCFKIGGMRIGNMQIAAIDLDYVNEMYNKHLNRKIIGLLGCDFCVKYQVIIDYSRKQMTFRREKIRPNINKH